MSNTEKNAETRTVPSQSRRVYEPPTLSVAPLEKAVFGGAGPSQDQIVTDTRG
jgi:hypothetical protein